MKETYTCPRCSVKYGDRYEEDNLWFLKNAGYINLGCCVECETPDEGARITTIWKDYLTSTGIGVKNAQVEDRSNSRTYRSVYEF